MRAALSVLLRSVAPALAAAGLLLGPLVPPGTPQSLSGRRAPSFALPDSALKRYDLLDYRGKWLLLNFVTTRTADCPGCRAFSQTIEAVMQKHGAAKVAVLTVVVAPPETTQTVSQYISATKMTSPVVFDQGQMTASYFMATPQRNRYDTPHLFAINPQGMIVKDWGQGASTASSLPAELDQLIGK